MGGDHKCPVCEATFTRPQHVARHMRSHTGDRPYKCQYCGDQFARSDLLSRHVNKCHANEKPLPSTGTRKKGSVSASRATTSKQVCDQCVQANSSCDGSNPCAKCIQRRYRCTFVKFHRQTAPLGPGHTIRTGADPSFSNPPSPNSISASSPSSKVSAPSSSSRIPVFHHQQQSDDEFILGPPPNVVPTMADTLYGATPFTFPPLYPTSDISGDNTDYVGKYRAHAELFGSSRSSAIPASSSSMVSPNIYDPRPPSSWLGWGQQDPTDPYQQHQQRHADLISDPAHPPPSLSPIPSSMNDKDMQAELARRHHQQHQQRSNTNSKYYMDVSIPFSTASNYQLVSDPNGTNNRGADSTDIRGSDSASSSAASSFVHLPLDGVDERSLLVRGVYDNINNGAFLVSDRRATSSASSSSSSLHHHPEQHHQNLAFQSKQVSFPTTHDENAFSSNQHHQHQHQPHSHHPHHHLPQHVISDLDRPEFSSAFGLLSIDDPNVIAGIATDGTPFFDDPNQAHNQARSAASGSTDVVQLGGGGSGVADVDTPMPMKRGSRQLQSPSLEKFSASAAENGSTPSREKESKELKEFWKQYMRIPLGGSDIMSSGGGSEGVTPSGNESGGPSASAAAYARRPSLGMDMDTGMGNADDLRSYEAAVMARKARTTLNLKVRRPMRGRGGGKLRDEGSASASSGNSPRAMGSGDITDCSSSSSLANAFGTGRLGSHSRDPTVLPAAAPGGGGVLCKSTSATTLPFVGGGRVKKEEESASPSLSSPASSAEGDDGTRSELGSSPLMVGGSSRNVTVAGVGRPSFKRLPSQTLGPDNSKRPFYGFVDDRVVSGWGAVGNSGGDDAMIGGGGGSAERKMMRRRRMSEPSSGVATSAASGGGGGFEREDVERRLSRVDVSAVQNVDELWFY